jgi:hypothetical protein
MSDETAYQPRIKIAWLIGTLAAFALFVAIGAYSKRMARDYTDYDQDRATQRYVTLVQVRHDEQALISTTEWVDQAKGVIRIPIEEAMSREIDTLKAQPVQAGGAILVTPVSTALPPSAGATNAAPAKPSTPAAPSTNAAPTAAGPAAVTVKSNP